MFEPTEELTAISACPARLSSNDPSLEREVSPFRATAIELTASGIDVAAAKKVTLETMVGICT